MAAASAMDAAIQKKIYGSSTALLIILNEEMNDIMKLVKSLEESGLLIKSVSETIKNEAKEQNARFLGILSGTLSASLLGNMLAGKPKIPGGVIRPGEGVIRPDEGVIATSYSNETRRNYSRSGFLSCLIF